MVVAFHWHRIEVRKPMIVSKDKDLSQSWTYIVANVQPIVEVE